jgi:hypothetical protein
MDVKCVNKHTLREDYLKEYQFITDLISRTRLPNTDVECSGKFCFSLVSCYSTSIVGGFKIRCNEG